MRRVALAGLLAVLGGIAVLSTGPYMPMCLDLLTTDLTCAAGMAAAGHPWSPGPQNGLEMVVAVPLTLLVALVVPWARLDRRSRVGIALLGTAGAVGGALAYGALAPTTMSGWSPVVTYDATVQRYVEQGQEFIVAPIAANEALRRITAMVVAAVTVGMAATILARVKRTRDAGTALGA